MKPMLAILSLFLLLLAGCEKSPPEGHSAVSAEAGTFGENENQAEGQERLLTPRILPEAPRSSKDLRVSHAGSGASVRYSWWCNGQPIPGAEGEFLSRTHFRKGDEIAVRVEIDGRRGEAKTVIGNTPPRIERVKLRHPQYSPGDPLEIVPEATDVDGDVISFRYAWSANGEEIFGNDAPVLPPESFRGGDRIQIRVIPSDGEEEGEAFVGNAFEIPNSPPRFTSVPSGAFSGAEFVYQAVAEDPDGDAVSYFLEKGPEGMKVDAATGLLTWRIDPALGEARIRIAARDEHRGEAFQEFSWKRTEEPR